MAVDAAAIRAEVGAGVPTSIPDAFLTSCIAVADELLKQYAGDDYRTAGTIPVTVAEKAWLAVAVEIFNQRRAPNGVLTQQFATPDGGAGGVAVRVGADPLRPAYGLLKRYLGTGIA